MNDTPKTNLPKNLAEAIGLAAAAQQLCYPARMKQHRLNIQGIAFNGGIDGVQQYKTEYPESAKIQVRHNPLAYIPKPKGYTSYLANLAERWLHNAAARATSNADDVRALNERLNTTYPPGKHFSDPLSVGRRKAIQAVFRSHRFPFDVKAITTMSGVKAAARANMALQAGERRLGSVGIISGNTLVMKRQPFTVTRNGGRECIRVMIGETRQRVYLDQIEWLDGLLGLGGMDPLSTMEHSYGDVAYPAVPTNLPTSAPAEMSGLACAETCPVDPLEF